MSINSIKRIMSDISKLKQQPLDSEGIYWHLDEDNVYNFKALIIGPENTPYNGGFFLFEFIIPENYPLDPPKAKYHTQYNNIRFNPNLYTNGKVCLSMLNTWSGPSWTPCNTLSSILISLLGMVFVDHPLVNEPGHENTVDYILDNYDAIIEYASLRGGVLYMINNTPPGFEMFKTKMEEYFIENFDKYMSVLKLLYKKRNNKTYTSGIFNMTHTCNYADLIGDYQKTYEKLTGIRVILNKIPLYRKITVKELREIANINKLDIRFGGKYKLKRQLYDELSKLLEEKTE